MKHAIYLMTEDECAELHMHLAAVMRYAGAKDGPQLDQCIADLFTIASATLDRQRMQEETRQDSIKLVKG